MYVVLYKCISWYSNVYRAIANASCQEVGAGRQHYIVLYIAIYIFISGMCGIDPVCAGSILHTQDRSCTIRIAFSLPHVE